MHTLHIALSDEEYERLRCIADRSGTSADAIAETLLREALRHQETTRAEQFLRAVELVHQQYGAPTIQDTTAIVREFRERDE